MTISLSQILPFAALAIAAVLCIGNLITWRRIMMAIDLAERDLDARDDAHPSESGYRRSIESFACALSRNLPWEHPNKMAKIGRFDRSGQLVVAAIQGEHTFNVAPQNYRVRQVFGFCQIRFHDVDREASSRGSQFYLFLRKGQLPSWFDHWS